MNRIQCRMARSALNWTTRRLADEAGIGARELQTFLGGGPVSEVATKRMRDVFEEQGLVFVDEERGGQGFGVRFRRAFAAAGDHQKPRGLATDAVERMEAEIAADRRKGKM